MTATSTSLGVFAFLTLPLLVQADNAGALPRYRFQPGQELNYHATSQFKYGEGDKAGEHGTTVDSTVWVLRLNSDGSARLILREKNVFSQTHQGKKTDQPARITIVYADVFPDGRVLPNKSIQYQGHPGTLFPPLPHDAAQAKSGWEGQRDGDKMLYKPVASKESFAFDLVTDSVFNKIYLSSSNAKYHFDPAKGFVTKIDAENTQGYGFTGKGAGTTELVSVKTMNSADLQNFTLAADKFFAATTSYEEKLEAAQKAPPEEAKKLLTQAVEALEAEGKKIDNAELKGELAEKISQHKQMEKYYLSSAEQRAKVLGKPAAEFETTAIDGKEVKLANLRGQVVVLDFWYRGCGWCIKAMPQMNQLADDFAGKPVTIFGMNTDREVKDAKFVMEKMALKYPTLKAEGLPQRFGVQGFPTLIIIDQQGKVYDIHVGYSPTLREEVGKQIQALLAKN